MTTPWLTPIASDWKFTIRGGGSHVCPPRARLRNGARLKHRSRWQRMKTGVGSWFGQVPLGLPLGIPSGNRQTTVHPAAQWRKESRRTFLVRHVSSGIRLAHFTPHMIVAGGTVPAQSARRVGSVAGNIQHMAAAAASQQPENKQNRSSCVQAVMHRMSANGSHAKLVLCHGF